MSESGNPGQDAGGWPPQQPPQQPSQPPEGRQDEPTSGLDFTKNPTAPDPVTRSEDTGDDPNRDTTVLPTTPPAGGPPPSSFGAPPASPYAPPASPYAPPQSGYGTPPQSAYGTPSQSAYGTPPLSQPGGYQPGYSAQPESQSGGYQAGYGQSAPPAGSGYQPTQQFGPGFGEQVGGAGSGSGYQQPGYGSGFQQSGYQQPSYQPAGYQQPGYGSGFQQPGYQQPGYQQQPGFGAAPYGQAPAKKSRKGLWVSLLALIVVVAVALVLVFVVFKSEKKLSHTAVEKYITDKLGATDVTCNNGKDFAMKHNGDKFTCTAAGGKSYTVTITNKSDGHYTVQ